MIGTPELVLSVGSRTDVGLRRAVNEDSTLAQHPIYAVADGMGGHEAGDRASQAVIAQLSALAGRADLVPDDLSIAIDAAHSSVGAIAEEMSRGAGSTVTGAMLVEQAGRPHWLVFNIGDSRVYRYRPSRLEQLTVDHSVVQGLVDDGTLAKDEVATYKGRNVITRAVGADDSGADFWLYPVVTGESLLLCSDGLTGEVDDDTIGSVLSIAQDPQVWVDRLVELALAGGGRDNVSVVIVSVTAGGLSSDIDEATGAVGPLGPLPDDLDESTIEMPRRRTREAQ